jgi:hypothetical protein
MELEAQVGMLSRFVAEGNLTRVWGADIVVPSGGTLQPALYQNCRIFFCDSIAGEEPSEYAAGSALVGCTTHCREEA